MKKLLLLITFVAGVIAFALPAQAELIKFDLNVQFSSDGIEPGGNAPWLTATFEDIVVDGVDKVRLTMNASKLMAGEFVNGGQGRVDKQKGWYFNFNDEDNLDDLIFKYILGNQADTVTATADTYKAGGDGSFDILFAWSNQDRLLAGQTAVYDITSSGIDISATSFNVISEIPSGGEGYYYSAAHVQGIFDPDGSVGNTDGSCWIGDGGDVDHVDSSSYHHAPEPTTMLLLGSGLIGIAVSGKKRLKKRNGMRTSIN